MTINYGELSQQAEGYSAPEALTPDQQRQAEWEAEMQLRQQDSALYHDEYPHDWMFIAELWDNPERAELLIEHWGRFAYVSLDDTYGGAARKSYTTGDIDLFVYLSRITEREEYIRQYVEPEVREHTCSALRFATQVHRKSRHIASNGFRATMLDGHNVDSLPEPEWIVSGMFQAGEVVAAVGRKSAGKSTLFAVDLPCAVVTGVPWIGQEVAQGKVLVIVAEGSRSEYAERVKAWSLTHPEAGDPWAEGLSASVRSLDICDRTEHITDDEGHTRSLTTAAYDVTQLVELVREDRPSLVIIDNLAASMNGRSEMSGPDITSALAACQRVTDLGATVLMIHHTNESDLRPRGLTQFEDRMSSIAHVKIRGLAGDRLVTCYKPPRLGAAWEPIKVRLVPVDGTQAAAFTTEGSSDADAIYTAMREMGDEPVSKSAILARAHIRRAEGLRLIDELADDPDEPLEREGSKYRLAEE